MLSRETLQVLRIAGEYVATHSTDMYIFMSIYVLLVYSFTEMAEHLLSLEGVSFLLSERFNQDPLEIYFSKQRQRGGRSDNPSMQQCLQNAQALYFSKSLALGNYEREKLSMILRN